MKAVKGELLWFLRGDTNVRWLQERGITIWDEWLTPPVSWGRFMGTRWRSWQGADGATYDQIAQLVADLRG